MIYLLIGEDFLSKDAKINQIKEEALGKGSRGLDFERLYAKDLHLKELQEKLLSFPLQAKRRVVVIKDAQLLRQKEELKDFLLDYVKDPPDGLILILDACLKGERDAAEAAFLDALSGDAKVFTFGGGTVRQPDAFGLARQIELRQAVPALRLLKQLLDNGQRPEMIMGGLRSSWEKNTRNIAELQKRLKVLLSCDREIKTGKLEERLALERLVTRLCYLKTP